jgi:hypothetical protein
MPTKTQPGLSEDQAITALRSRPEAAQKALLAKMDPATKQRVLAKLSAPTASPQEISVLDPNADAKKKTAKRAGAVDYMLDQLPTAVGTGASMLGGSKALPTGLAAAGAGGVLGEDIREVLGKHLYSDPGRKAAVSDMTAGETAKKLATAGAEQSGAELAGRGVGGVFSKLAEKIGLTGAAESAAKAAAGDGVQKTPGDVTGNRAQKFLEHFLNYMPGAMGPMGKFEEQRAGQATAMIGKQLDEISTKGLSKEQAGEAVSKVIDHMHETAAKEANAAYNPLKKPLGLADGATRDEIEAAAKKAASPTASGVLDASGKPIMRPGDDGKALADLRAADKAYGASRDNIERDLVGKIANTNRTEAVHQYVSKASLNDLRTILPKLAPETHQAIARNVMEDALNAGSDPVTGQFNAKAAMKALNALDKDGPKTAMLFGKNAETVRAALKEIASIQTGHSPGGGMAGHRVLTGIIGAVAGAGLVSGHGAETLASIGGEMGAARLLAELVTNPETSMKVLMALRRVAKGAVRVGVPAAADYIRGDSFSNVPSPQELSQPAAQ